MEVITQMWDLWNLHLCNIVLDLYGIEHIQIVWGKYEIVTVQSMPSWILFQRPVQNEQSSSL